MTSSFIRLIRKRFAAVSTAILVPSIGLWLTYWERDHADREVKQKSYEYAVKQHDEFVHAIGELLLQGKFDYLDDWEVTEKADYLEMMDSEAIRLNISKPSTLYALKRPETPRPTEKPLLSRLYGSRLALVLEAARITNERHRNSGSQKKIAKEVLHFLRSNRLLAYGGLLSHFSDSDFSGLDLSSVNLSCTNLDSIIRRTNFRDANLAGIFFSRSAQGDIVDESDFSGARLAWSRIEGKRITNADFSRSNMQLSSLSWSAIAHSSFENADLRHVIMVDSVIHDSNKFAGADMRGAILMIDKERSALGAIFAGAIANSKPIKLDDGRIVPPVILPEGRTLAELGLIEAGTSSISHLRKKSPRDANDANAILLGPECHWRPAFMWYLAEIYYKYASKGVAPSD
jgi:uncharacterized protein YjbI with pentapeptide repeats